MSAIDDELIMMNVALVGRNYWRDHDTALFILKHLYRDIPEDPNSAAIGGSTGWNNQREKAEEELPLTFSDNVMVRNFSSKAKKVLKNNS